jgi:hypothetical protein
LKSSLSERREGTVSEEQQTRREFIRKAIYVTPVIFTLSVTPSIASITSVPSKTSAGSKTGPVQEQLQKQDGKIESLKLESRYQLSKK